MPYYSRDDKNIKGKVEDYYRRELDILEEITDQDFKEGVHAMFKHHYNWIAKDVGAARAGYNPDADMYVDLPSEFFSDAACHAETPIDACPRQGPAPIRRRRGPSGRRRGRRRGLRRHPC